MFIPVLGFENNITAGVYIAGFILGILVAMSAFSLIVGKISSFAKNEHNQNLYRGIRLTGGIFAIIIGFYWLIEH